MKGDDIGMIQFPPDLHLSLKALQHDSGKESNPDEVSTYSSDCFYLNSVRQSENLHCNLFQVYKLKPKTQLGYNKPFLQSSFLNR